MEAASAGTELRDAGMARAARNNQDVLSRCRRWLRSLGGPVSADDVRIWIEAQADRAEITSRSLNWMGSVFRGREWQLDGRVRSNYPANHARFINVYRLA